MILGADTGFFTELAKRNTLALEILSQVSKNKAVLVVSTLTIHELIVFSYRRGRDKQTERIIEILYKIPSIIVTNVNNEIVWLSAKFQHSLGLHTVDSVILATHVCAKCTEIITTDKDFEKVEGKDLIKVKYI